MDMDLKDVIEFLHASARSLGAEVTSPWFYLQFGLILAAFGIAFAADATIRARVDMSSVAMKWPLPLRRLAHVLVGSASTVVFAILVIASRVVMYHSTWPSRSYLLIVAAKLALAWLGIRLYYLRDPQRLHRPRGVDIGLADRGLEHPRPARTYHRAAGLPIRSRSCSADCG